MMHVEQFADGCARRDVAFRHSGASGTAGTGKGGKVIGSGQPQIGPGLIHAGDGRRKILVMQQRFFHQLVQHGIIEAFPPLDFKTPCRHGQTVGSLAPCFGDVHRRAVVVRGEGTAGQCHARDQAERRAVRRNAVPVMSVLPISRPGRRSFASSRLLGGGHDDFVEKGNDKRSECEAASMPNTTLMPMARRLDAPAPVLTASGTQPRMKASEVMMMGRKRSLADARPTR